MNKNKMSKIIVLIITFTLIACISTSVFADDGTLDLSNSIIGGNNTTNTTNTQNTVTPTNTTNTQNTTVNKINTTNTTNKTNNTSTYKESIPYAGPETSILMGSAFVVCAIIGVYTFMKLSDYSNI